MTVSSGQHTIQKWNVCRPGILDMTYDTAHVTIQCPVRQQTMMSSLVVTDIYARTKTDINSWTSTIT